MGFFDLKVTCSVCMNEVGLNRYKVKKSNAWICPKCLKAAGGIAKVNVNKITIEEINKLIENKNNESKVESIEIENEILSNNVKRELKKGDSINTAEKMYKYCIINEFGEGWNEEWGIKHFKIIEENLMRDEEVKMAFIGLHNYISTTKQNGNFAYVITNKRIMMAQKKKIAGEYFQTVSLDNINDITFKSGMLMGIVTIDTIKETFNIGLDKTKAKKINKEIHSVIEEIRKISVLPETQKQNEQMFSIADELKKYKELLDLGVLTEEEFHKQKEKLLNN